MRYKILDRKAIFILFLLIAGGLAALHSLYGIFSPYNYWTAKWDIAVGKLRILQYGETTMTDKYAVLIAPKFGFHYEIVAGCVVSPPEINGINAYNSAMESYLNNKIGNKWKNKFGFQVDSLFRANRVDVIRKTVLSIDEVKEMRNYLDSLSNGQRHIYIWVLPQEKEANARAGEMMADSSIKIFYYYSVDPYSLRVSKIHY